MEENSTENATLRIGKRVAEIAVMENLNQKTLAEKLGVSQGFLSSVINDQKIPGSEFLYTLNKLFGISADWVLTGEGGMYGGSKINIRLQKEIQLYIGIARAAIVDGNETAQILLTVIKESRLHSHADNQEVQGFLKTISKENQDIELITAIYNNNIWVNDAETQRRRILAAAIEHFELKTPVNILSSAKDHANTRVQINIGKNQRNIQGDYFERK